MKLHEFTFVYFRSLVWSLSVLPLPPPPFLFLPLTPSLSARWSEKERSVNGDGTTKTELKRKKERSEAWQRGTVRSDARQRRGEPATSQPDCKTLYKTREARVRTIGFVHPLTAANLLSSILAAIACVRCSYVPTGRNLRRREDGHSTFKLYADLHPSESLNSGPG